MAKRVAGIFSLLRTSVHRISPGTQFSVYSGYQTPDNAKRYGVDWRYVGERQAVDRAECGYGRPIDAVNATIDALKGIPLVGGVIVTPHSLAETRPPMELTPAAVLRQFLDSTGGILAYSYMEMGGQSWYAVSQVSRFVAEYEDMLLKGERFSLQGNVGTAEAVGIKSGNYRLICMMNNKSKDLKIRASLPDDAINGYEYFGGTKVDFSQPIELILNPGEVRIYILTTNSASVH